MKYYVLSLTKKNINNSNWIRIPFVIKAHKVNSEYLLIEFNKKDIIISKKKGNG